jgi:hypothetical protein
MKGGFSRGGEGEEKRNTSSPSSPLEPPLEVLETFGGAKVSDDDQLKTEHETFKKTIKSTSRQYRLLLFLRYRRYNRVMFVLV